MIRDTLDPGSNFMSLYFRPGIDRPQLMIRYRFIQDDAARELEGPAVTLPHWVKMESLQVGKRIAYAAYESSDGVTWNKIRQLKLLMDDPSIGLAVTSHQPGVATEAIFSDVSTDVVGPWISQDIGILSNDPQPMYLAVDDGQGRRSLVQHEDPEVTTNTSWQNWTIDLDVLGDVNRSQIASVAVGVGDPNAAEPAGSGTVYLDDVGLIP